jgi:hypothetical protein
MHGPRQPGSPSSPRRPLSKIDNVFLDQSSVPGSDQGSSPASVSLKRPLEKDLSPPASKKPALQPRAVPSQLRGSSRRVSSGRSRKVPLSEAESANVRAASSESNIHDEIESNRKSLRQIKADVAGMRQKVLMDLEPAGGSPSSLPRSPVTRNIKSKLAEEAPPDFAVWMKDVDDRLDVLLAKYIEVQKRAVLTSASTDSHGVQTDPSPVSPVAGPGPNVQLQIAALSKERDMLKTQLGQLNMEMTAAFDVSSLACISCRLTGRPRLSTRSSSKPTMMPSLRIPTLLTP